MKLKLFVVVNFKIVWQTFLNSMLHCFYLQIIVNLPKKKNEINWAGILNHDYNTFLFIT